MSDNKKLLANKHYVVRHIFLLGVFLLLFTGLIARAAYLQAYEQDFLVSQGEQRQVRQIETLSQRGDILDRNGEVLAVSTPVDSVWVLPKKMLENKRGAEQLAQRLGIDKQAFIKRLERRSKSQFMYVKRQLQPAKAKQVVAGIDGAYLRREYHRFYPHGEMIGHVTGVTNIDDEGQEGMEYLFDEWMSPKKGSRVVVQNRMGEVIEEVENRQPAIPGKTLQSSIDVRLQYIAYRALKAAVQKHNAVSGSAILLNAKTGEVLAMVNRPSFNPNDRKSMKSSQLRNRAVTDLFEPGSTMKPFTMAVALEEQIYHSDSWLDTSPGWMLVNGNAIKDFKNYKRLDMTGILRKSSNVGAAKIALSIGGEDLWDAYHSFGFGEATGIEYPGETSGYLPSYTQWSRFDLATKAFGYGMSSSVAQLARAYLVLANDGQLLDLSLLKLDEQPTGKQVIKPETAKMVRHMLQAVVGPGGTAKQAAIKGYSIAGKTGTVKKSNRGGYSDDRYIAIFAGMAPAVDPKLVLVVAVNEPRRDVFYGGTVAAPVFKEIIEQSVRVLNISPDEIPAQTYTYRKADLTEPKNNKIKGLDT